MRPVVISINIPDHKPGEAPDHETVGTQLDALLKQHFLRKKVVIRCIGSRDHNISFGELAEKIIQNGTDKYDDRIGVGYKDFIRKGIKVDFYGEEVEITEDLNFMPQQIWEMHHSAIGDRGYGVHVDLILIYDASQLDMVMNLYNDHPTSDGFVFKDASNKQAALLGIINVRGD